MADELVTMDAPADAAIPEIEPQADTGTGEGSESADGQQPEGQQDGQQPEPGTPKPFSGPAVKDGKLNPALKSTLDEIKAKSPAAAKALTEALFYADRIRREIPGGLKDIAQMRSTIEELGGSSGISEIQGELNGWREFDQKYTAADPTLIEFMTETPDAQGAFVKLAPLVFEKFRELHPEGYTSHVSGVMFADMQAARIPLMLERLGDFLPADNPRAKEAWQQIATYVNRIAELASKAPGPPKIQAAAQPDTKAKELETREVTLTRQEWRGETDKAHSALFRQEWAKQLGGRKLSSEQNATVRELYGLRLSAILKQNREFNPTLERYFNSKQKDGFVRYMQSAYQQAVPRALRAAIQQAGIGGKPGPQGGTPAKPQAGQPPAKPGVAAKPASGFTFVNAKPAPETVDRTRTTTDMWLQKRAVLKDGRAVQWK